MHFLLRRGLIYFLPLVALLTTSAAIGVTSDLPSTLLTRLSRRMPTSPVGFFSQSLTVVITRPTPLVLLAMCIFYLWVYMRKAPSPLASDAIKSA